MQSEVTVAEHAGKLSADGRLQLNVTVCCAANAGDESSKNVSSKRIYCTPLNEQ